jgi:hypothetical protein
VSTIGKLFFEEHVLVTEGHTKITLDFLQKTTNFVVHGVVRSVGGPRSVTRDLRDRVLKRTLEPTKHGGIGELNDYPSIGSGSPTTYPTDRLPHRNTPSLGSRAQDAGLGDLSARSRES